MERMEGGHKFEHAQSVSIKDLLGRQIIKGVRKEGWVV